MYKLMRRVLILTILCLVFVAITTPNMKAKASACSDANDYAVYMFMRAAVICTYTCCTACESAVHDYLVAEGDVSHACNPPLYVALPNRTESYPTNLAERDTKAAHALAGTRAASPYATSFQNFGFRFNSYID